MGGDANWADLYFLKKPERRFGCILDILNMYNRAPTDVGPGDVPSEASMTTPPSFFGASLCQLDMIRSWKKPFPASLITLRKRTIRDDGGKGVCE